MVFRFRIMALFAVLLGFSISQATIHTVSINPGSAQYTSIQTAHNAASAGDTILVGPGTYVGALNPNRRLHYIGAGWDVCTIQATGHTMQFSATGARSTVEGFRMDATGYGIYLNNGNDSITVRRCLITSGSPPLGIESGRVYVEDCILISNSNSDVVTFPLTALSGNCVFRNVVFTANTPAGFTQAFEGNHGGVIELYNCVFLNMYNAFTLTGLPQVIGLNNIFWDWVSATGFGTLPVGSVFEHTASGGSSPSFPANFTNNITLGANNPFVNYNNTSNYQIGITDLHLNGGTGGLLCVDAGYPSIFDLDASRSDCGLYGGPKPLVENGLPAYPFAITLNIDNLVEVGDSVTTTSTGRIGPRY